MIADFFVEILTGATEMLTALGTVITDALELFYDSVGNAVTPLGTLVLTIAGVGLAYSIVGFVLGFIKSIGSRASRGR
jgi:hypothetical protein